MEREVLKAVYLAGSIVMLLIRAPYARMTRRERIAVDHRGAREVLLLTQLGLGWGILPLLYVFTPFLGFADYRLPGWSGWVGAALLAGALWLFWRSHAALRENWTNSVQLRRGHDLVTTGVYARIRHPMYASAWIFSVAQVLLLHNWLAGWSALVTFGILYFARVGREERMMLDHFGEPYREYMRRTGRVLPIPTLRGA
jgi:protein-S-isoprenylcysteine O-methyltransferase Ste14